MILLSESSYFFSLTLHTLGGGSLPNVTGVDSSASLALFVFCEDIFTNAFAKERDTSDESAMGVPY